MMNRHVISMVCRGQYDKDLIFMLFQFLLRLNDTLYRELCVPTSYWSNDTIYPSALERCSIHSAPPFINSPPAICLVNIPLPTHALICCFDCMGCT